MGTTIFERYDFTGFGAIEQYRGFKQPAAEQLAGNLVRKGGHPPAVKREVAALRRRWCAPA